MLQTTTTQTLSQVLMVPLSISVSKRSISVLVQSSHLTIFSSRFVFQAFHIRMVLLGYMSVMLLMAQVLTFQVSICSLVVR